MGLHDVNFDPDAVDAAFGDFEQSATPAQSGQLMPQQQPAPADEWLVFARMAASMLADGIAPNWHITPELREEWAQALALCLDDLMPGGLANMAAWGPWAKLAFASTTIALAGFDMETGKFLPLKPEPPKAARPAAQTRTQGFTTGGSPAPVDDEGSGD